MERHGRSWSSVKSAENWTCFPRFSVNLNRALGKAGKRHHGGAMRSPRVQTRVRRRAGACSSSSLATDSISSSASKSLYLEILDPGVKDTQMLDLWKSNIPLKIRIFTWTCIRGRIQVTAELKKKGWPGDPICKLCGESGTVNHLVFGCPLSHFVWWWFKTTWVGINPLATLRSV